MVYSLCLFRKMLYKDKYNNDHIELGDGRNLDEKEKNTLDQSPIVNEKE